MISITRLLCDTAGPGDHLRYERKESPRPIVVWNCTRQCNLRCIHCYASATDRSLPGQIEHEAARAVIRDMADFKVPVILFSGGERAASGIASGKVFLALSPEDLKDIPERRGDVAPAEGDGDSGCARPASWG